MQLLWRGIAEYVFYYNISIMFGCASLPGSDPEALLLPLAYLYHHHLAPPALRPRGCRPLCRHGPDADRTGERRRGPHRPCRRW